jgi:hypothetical protein
MQHFIQAILIFFFFFPANSFSQSAKKEEWRLRKNEDGIRIYTRHTEKSSIDELKVVSVMHASLSSIAAVIMDADHFADWIYACEQSKILFQVSPTEQYQYQLIDVPAPFTDRDAVIHFTIRQDPKTKIVYTHSEAAPAYIPAKDGLVRLPLFDASYQLLPLSNGDVQVLYSLQLDPGGYIPDWLVNLTIVTGPFESTVKMQKQVQKPEYQNNKLEFIQEP